VYLHTREVATEGAGRGDAEEPRPLPRKGAKKLPRHPFREHSFSPPPSPLETNRFFNASRVARANPEFPLCATEGIGDEKARFLGFRTFASREKGLHTPLFQIGSGPGRLGSEAATLMRACRVALGGPSPRTPPEKVRAEASRERRRVSGDARRKVARSLRGIQRATRFCFFSPLSFRIFLVAQQRKGPFLRAPPLVLTEQARRGAHNKFLRRVRL